MKWEYCMLRMAADGALALLPPDTLVNMPVAEFRGLDLLEGLDGLGNEGWEAFSIDTGTV